MKNRLNFEVRSDCAGPCPISCWKIFKNRDFSVFLGNLVSGLNHSHWLFFPCILSHNFSCCNLWPSYLVLSLCTSEKSGSVLPVTALQIFDDNNSIPLPKLLEAKQIQIPQSFLMHHAVQALKYFSDLSMYSLNLSAFLWCRKVPNWTQCSRCCLTSMKQGLPPSVCQLCFR